MVAREVGGYLRSDLAVSPGKFTRKPRLSADSNVVSTGENNAAWAKVTNFAGVGAPTGALATRLDGACIPGGAVKFHNFVVVLRVPEK